MKSKSLWILGVVAVLAVAPAFARMGFKAIPGGEFLTPVDMTADGSKLLLYGNGTQYTWSEAEGLVDIGGMYCNGMPSMSDDGTTIASTVYDENGICQAAKWLGGQDWLPMGSEPGGVPCGDSLSTVFGTNNDTAVGLFWRAQECTATGGTWDLATGTAGPGLVSTVPDRPTRGNAINNDGSIVVGWQDQETGYRSAVKWVNGVQEYVLTDNGNVTGEALGVNSTGTVIYGAQFGEGNGEGWLWRAGKGMIPMGRGGIGVNIQSPVVGASEDGSTVIGITRNFSVFVQTGFIWTEKKGWSELNDFVKGQIAAGWNLDTPSVISSDGRFIAGRGFTPDGGIAAWIIDLNAKGPK